MLPYVHPQRGDGPARWWSRPRPPTQGHRRRCRVADRAAPDPRSRRAPRSGGGRRRSATTHTPQGDLATEPRSGSATGWRSPPDGAGSRAGLGGRCAQPEETAPTGPTAHRSDHDDHARHHPNPTHYENFVRHALVPPCGLDRQGDAGPAGPTGTRAHRADRRAQVSGRARRSGIILGPQRGSHPRRGVVVKATNPCSAQAVPAVAATWRTGPSIAARTHALSPAI